MDGVEVNRADLVGTGVDGRSGADEDPGRGIVGRGRGGRRTGDYAACTGAGEGVATIGGRGIGTELTGGDPDEFALLLADFLASTAADMAELDRLHAAALLPDMTRQAHKIKGAARLVGAHHLGETAAALEAAGRSGHGDAVAILIDRLHAAVAQLQAHTQHAG